jgi:hypothetical protein
MNVGQFSSKPKRFFAQIAMRLLVLLTYIGMNSKKILKYWQDTTFADFSFKK